MIPLIQAAVEKYWDPATYCVLADWFEDDGDTYFAQFIRERINNLLSGKSSYNFTFSGVANQLKGISLYAGQGVQISIGTGSPWMRLIGGRVDMLVDGCWEVTRLQDISADVRKALLMIRLRELSHQVPNEEELDIPCRAALNRGRDSVYEICKIRPVGEDSILLALDTPWLDTHVCLLEWCLDHYPPIRQHLGIVASIRGWQNIWRRSGYPQNLHFASLLRRLEVLCNKIEGD